MFITIASFVLFTGLVLLATWFFTRKTEHRSQDGFFLAGRSLTWPFIAGSLLLTNLSTEQMVGLNGSAYANGLCVMAWEVVAVAALVLMAMFFLPRFLRAGVTTVPEYLAQRFDSTTELICNLIFLIAYAAILLPIILYTGAQGMRGIMGLDAAMSAYGITSEYWQLFIVVTAVAVIGSFYALWGGLDTCAVSDTFNGVGLLIGGFLITYFGMELLGGGAGASGGLEVFARETRASGKLNSMGSATSEVPFFTLFTGVLFINVFYWCTNQQIIQRTFGAKSLAEGQKGVLMTGLLKLIGPLYLVIPGLIAAVAASSKFGLIPVATKDTAYSVLVNAVLPKPLLGFFAAVLLGAILSSFNSALNSTCTMFSLGLYRRWWHPGTSDREVVGIGRYFGLIMTVICIFVAPLLVHAGGIFNYLQTMNAIYFIPILAVVAVGMTTRKVPAPAAATALVGGVAIIAAVYFIPPLKVIIAKLGSEYHFVALVLALLIAMMLIWGHILPRKTAYVPVDAGKTDMTKWKSAPYAALALLAIVAFIYIYFADPGVL